MLLGHAPAPRPPGKARRRIVAALAALVAPTIFAILPAACSGSSSTTVRPTTGILVRAETLTTGRGCGRGPTNLFKYAVVVFGYTNGSLDDRASFSQPVTSNVFDCFTDGAFIQLAAINEVTKYRLEVYAYNEPAYTAFRDAIEGAGTNTVALRTTAPTWTTECSVEQQPDVQTLAVCNALAGGLGGLGGGAPATKITLGTSSFRLSDGRIARCQTTGDAGADGASDAAVSDAGGDAEAGAPADAGAPISFATARIRYRIGANLGPTVDLACPTTYVADVPAEPARYDIDVGVIDSAGKPLGTTACTVTSQTGATSSAVCP